MFSTQMSFIPKSGEGWAVSKEVGLGEVTSKEKVVGIKRAFGFKKKKKVFQIFFLLRNVYWNHIELFLCALAELSLLAFQ